MTAALFLAAGAETALGERRGDHRAPDALRWAPLVAAPVASALHAARALWPSRATRMMSQVADGLAIGVGVAGIASSLYSAVQDDEEVENSAALPSLAPLAFAAVGVLGMLLDREEEEIDEERESLERRASLVERFVPQRKARVDRIVVHI